MTLNNTTVCHMYIITTSAPHRGPVFRDVPRDPHTEPDTLGRRIPPQLTGCGHILLRYSYLIIMYVPTDMSVYLTLPPGRMPTHTHTWDISSNQRTMAGKTHLPGNRRIPRTAINESQALSPLHNIRNSERLRYACPVARHF